MNSLDNILSGSSEAAPAQDERIEQSAAQATADEGQQAGEQQEQPEQQAEGDKPGQRMVPHEALHAEKQKVKRYTEEVSEFRKQLAESNAAWERRVAAILEAQKPKQEPPAPPDFFENPQAATRHELTQAVTPEFERVNQALMAQAQMLAGMKYGDDKVQEAEQAFISAMQSRTLDPADYQRVVNSPNRYAAAAEWHKRQQIQSEIGTDPAAYKAKLEAEIREKVLAEINGGQQPAQQRPAGPTPSNLAAARNVGSRSGPAWSGPSSIADIFHR